MEELANLVQKYLREGDHPSMVSILCPLTVWSRRQLFQLKSLTLALHEAYTAKGYELLKYIVELRVVNIDEMNGDHLTVLYRAVWDKNRDMVEFLLQHGAQVVKADESVSRRSCVFPEVLRVALEKEDVDIIKMLLEAGATLDSVANGCSLISRRNFSEITDLLLEYGLAQHKKLFELFLILALYRGQSQVIDKLWPLRQRTGVSLVGYAFYLITSRLAKREHLEMLAEVSPIRLKLEIYEMAGARFVIEGRISEGRYWWNKARALRLQNSAELSTQPLPAGSSEGEDVWELETLESNDNSLKPKAFLITERIWLKWHKNMGRTSTEDVKAKPSQVRRPGSSILYRALELGMDFFNCPTSEKAMMFALNNALSTAHADKERAAAVDWALRNLKFLLDSMKETRQKQKQSDEARHNVTVTFLDDVCHLCSKLSELDNHFLSCVDKILSLMPVAKAQVDEDLERLVMEFIRDDPCLRGRTRFHAACKDFSDRPSLIKLLVECSVQVISQCRVGCASHLRPDRDGRTPLHVLAGNISQEHLIDEDVLGTFLRNSAHLCSEDKFGQSVLDVLTSRDLRVDDFLPLPLQCVAAKLVREKLPKAHLQDNLIKELLLRH